MKRNQQIPTKCVLLLFAVLFSFSCSKNNNSGELKTINILEAEKSELKISEIAESIEYLPLASDSVLAPLDQVSFVNQYYYVKDHKSKFLRFDESGKLLNKIGRRGRGPGEYRYASKFIVHPDGNIYIIGGKPGEIMVFSPEGKFLRSFKLSHDYASNFALHNDKFLLFYGPDREHLVENMEVVDTDGKVLNTYKNKYDFERGKASIGFSAECLMYQLEEELYIKEIFSDTLLCLNKNEFVPKIILNSGKRQFTPEARTKMIEETSKDPRASSPTWVYSLLQNHLFETENYLFYSYGYDKKARLLVYNKSNENLVEIDLKLGIINDWDGGPNIWLKMNKNDNTILAWVDAFELKSHVASETFKNSTPKYPEKKKELEQLANSLDENDNPVLMLVKLKE